MEDIKIWLLIEGIILNILHIIYRDDFEIRGRNIHLVPLVVFDKIYFVLRFILLFDISFISWPDFRSLIAVGVWA